MLGGTTLDRYLFDKLGNSKMGSTSYLSKPRIGSRSAYHTHTSDKENSYKNKKTRPRKSIPKMSEYGIKKRLPDYTELAYKEAVSRLRYFLSETYAPSSRSSKVGAPSIKNLDESGDEGFDPLPKFKYPLHGVYSGVRNTSSAYNPVYLPPKTSVLAPKRYPLYPRENYRTYGNEGVNAEVNIPSQSIPLGDASQSGKPGGHSGDPELMGFIQKQEEYIEQLERESSYCRDELNNLLGKVKEVISENETLHEKQKNHLIASVMDQRSASDSEEEDGEGDSDHKYSSIKSKKSPMKTHSKRLEGPNIVFESKISELEAQLTQANIDLKKMQEENGDIRRKISEGMVDSPSMDGFKRQIENLQRDKSSLEAQVNRLKSSLDDFKDTDSDLVSKAKRSADMVFQANHDKVQLEMEIRRLKEELERQQNRVRELLSEQARRVMEERSAVERRYCSQVEQLTSDLTTHWDSATKLQLELERQKREESDLKRELNQKNSQIEDLKMELKNKVASLQADMAQSHADKSAVEEELANARLMLERHQRQAKHDSNRLNSEIQSVRQRLDRADADLVHSRRENLRLIDQLANMEKEMNLGSLRPSSPRGKEREAIKEKELTGMIQNMEQKHAQTVSELEAMLCSQNGLMEKLTAECHLLTGKLDDASIRHKDEMASLQNKLELLSERVSAGSALYNPAPAMQPAIKTTDNKRATEPPISRQNSRGLVYDNQHATEARSNGAAPPIRNTRVEPDQRKTSRQPSRSNVIDNSDKRDEEIDERERFEKNFKESGPDKSNPNNSPLGVKKNYDISKVRLENNGSEHNLEDNAQDEQFEAQYDNEKMEYDQNQGYDDPNQQYVDPDQAHVEPSQEYVEPNQEYIDPNQQYVDPNQEYVDPNQAYVDPNQEYINPNQEYVDPNQAYTESVDPNQAYTESVDPNQAYTESVDPNQQYEQNQEYADPNQQYAEQNQEYADPNQPYAEQEYADPNQQYAEPSQQYATDPSQEITDINIPETQ